MDRVNLIFNNKKYQEYLKLIENAEIDRIYCHHDINHFMDVARLAVIISCEEKIEVPRDTIYAAAILHDIGRFVQYADGTPHELASAKLAPDILIESGYESEEIEKIVEAISEHGNEETKLRRDLAGIIYRADKLSRKCYYCKAADSCHKAISKRNMSILY